MNETLKKVAELLGFEVFSHVVESNGEYWYALVRDGKEYLYDEVIDFRFGSFDNYNCETEDEAWSQAPSAESLVLPILNHLRVLTRRNNGELVITETIDGGKYGVMFKNHTGRVTKSAWEETLTESVLLLFVRLCEAGLIDPKEVVLP